MDVSADGVTALLTGNETVDSSGNESKLERLTLFKPNKEAADKLFPLLSRAGIEEIRPELLLLPMLFDLNNCCKGSC